MWFVVLIIYCLKTILNLNYGIRLAEVLYVNGVSDVMYSVSV